MTKCYPSLTFPGKKTNLIDQRMEIWWIQQWKNPDQRWKMDEHHYFTQLSTGNSTCVSPKFFPISLWYSAPRLARKASRSVIPSAWNIQHEDFPVVSGNVISLGVVHNSADKPQDLGHITILTYFDNFRGIIKGYHQLQCPSSCSHWFNAPSSLLKSSNL